MQLIVNALTINLYYSLISYRKNFIKNSFSECKDMPARLATENIVMMLLDPVEGNAFVGDFGFTASTLLRGGGDG